MLVSQPQLCGACVPCIGGSPLRLARVHDSGTSDRFPPSAHRVDLLVSPAIRLLVFGVTTSGLAFSSIRPTIVRRKTRDISLQPERGRPTPRRQEHVQATKPFGVLRRLTSNIAEGANVRKGPVTVLWLIGLTAGIASAQSLPDQSRRCSRLRAKRWAVSNGSRPSAPSSSGRTGQVQGDNLIPIEFEIVCELPDNTFGVTRSRPAIQDRRGRDSMDRRRF